MRQAARIIKAVSQRSPHGQGNFNFAAISMLKPYGPFHPGAWHPGGGPRSFAIGLESANVVMDVFEREHDPRAAGTALAAALAVRLLCAVGSGSHESRGCQRMDVCRHRSNACARWRDLDWRSHQESFTGAPFVFKPGTETASGIITRSVQAVPVKQTGYSGLMIPVLEDAVLTRRWTDETYSLDSILAYSAVCAGGVDTVPLAGDISEDSIARIVGDVATLAFKWSKPLVVRGCFQRRERRLAR